MEVKIFKSTASENSQAQKLIVPSRWTENDGVTDIEIYKSESMIYRPGRPWDTISHTKSQ